jgi:hypothetical protein
MPGEQLGSEKTSTREHFELLTPVELAERLKVPTSWIRERTRSRDLQGNDTIPHLRLGRYVRFQWGSPELHAWLRRRLFAKSVYRSNPVC